MSLIKDLSNWARKTVFDTITFSFSMCFVACLLLIGLPKIIDPESPRYRDLNAKTINDTDQPKISQDLEAQIKDTKLRLLFRTHAHIADRLGIPQSDVILDTIQDKTWKDTSLECISPTLRGIVPITLTPELKNIKGWKIVYKVGNVRYEYHTSQRGDWVLCDKIEIPNDAYQYRSPLDR